MAAAPLLERPLAERRDDIGTADNIERSEPPPIKINARPSAASPFKTCCIKTTTVSFPPGRRVWVDISGVDQRLRTATTGYRSDILWLHADGLQAWRLEEAAGVTLWRVRVRERRGGGV